MSAQPVKSALARSASVKSMVASPLKLPVVRNELPRSAFVRLASLKSMLALTFPLARRTEPLRLAFARLVSLKWMAPSPLP